VTSSHASEVDSAQSQEIRVRGTVQGVGFRPNVWRLANECDLTGEVLNDASGVLIKVRGDAGNIERFKELLISDAPPLSKIDNIESFPALFDEEFDGFHISDSVGGATKTQISPDAATCSACLEETLDPFERRYRYPFTNCTHCGPRFSIVKSVPYDRANTSMAKFVLCEDCRKEYEIPSDRRFHAQPIACHACGPKASLEYFGEGVVTYDMHSMLDDVDAVCSLLQKGEIVAIRSIGGFNLACDATNEAVVKKLRARKNRPAKPFALMARDMGIIEQYCAISTVEKELLESPEAPIVLLKKHDNCALPDAIAPGLGHIGFMIPYTPMHHLILRRMDRPVVMTSANLTGAPQVTSNEAARTKLSNIADYALLHDREIENRVDDSLVKVVSGQARLLRRARGYAPSAVNLPKGFEHAPNLLAFGGELKATFCLLKDGAAILSQHQGDLEDAETFSDYQKNLKLFADIYDHEPEILAADKHPEYLSTKYAHEQAGKRKLPLIQIQHHHAHIASCMAENDIPLGASPILGIALDGLGYGDDGTIWGGEFMIADYRGYRRVGTFKPVAMLGGVQAIKEPWRNTYAHIIAEMGWDRFAMNFSDLDLFQYLKAKPRQAMDKMLKAAINVPLASSCGRLFDAVAAAIGLCQDQASYEGEGAMMLEAAVDSDLLRDCAEESSYPFSVPNLPANGMPYIEPLAMWQALLGDLVLKTPVPIMAARFHKGLAKAISMMVKKCIRLEGQNEVPINQIALSGGCFQNSVLLELVTQQLNELDFHVLTHARVPANDGGIALGQAAIAAANNMKDRS